MRRIKLSYTINSYNKFVVGNVIEEDEDFISVRSDRGDTIRVNKRNVDEEIILSGGGGDGDK